MEDKGSSEFDRPEKRHLAVAIPGPGTHLEEVECLSPTSPLICLPALSDTHSFLSTDVQPTAPSTSIHPLCPEMEGEVLLLCCSDASTTPFCNSYPASLVGQLLPPKRSAEVQLLIHVDFSPFHK